MIRKSTRMRLAAEQEALGPDRRYPNLAHSERVGVDAVINRLLDQLAAHRERARRSRGKRARRKPGPAAPLSEADPTPEIDLTPYQTAPFGVVEG